MFGTRISTRGLVLAAAAAGVIGAVAAIIMLNNTGSSGQEPGTRVEQRATGPAGQPGPVTVIVPNYPTDPGQPVTKGSFRLLPFGYRDPNTPVATATCEKASVNAADPAVVRDASLYVDVGFVPGDFQAGQPAATLVCGADVRELKWSLAGPKAAPLEIVRGVAQIPFDIRIPPIDSWYAVEDGAVNGSPAIFLRNKPGQQGPQTIYFFEGDVLTIIKGPVEDFSDLLKVAESLR